MTQISTPRISLIDDFCAEVIASRRKILFWDTCALLDIIRYPRDNTYLGISDLVKIHQEIMNDRVYSVASEITVTEFNTHEASTITDVKELIRKSSIMYESIINISNYFTSANLEYSHIDIVSFNLERYFIDIVDDIISKTYFIQKDEIASLWLDRIVNKKTPFKRKAEHKDAAIWSTCLSIADKINASSHAESVIFFSSNVNDYYEAGGAGLSRDILTECSSYNIYFSVDFGQAATAL